MNPLDYALCRQTVTVYRKIGDEISRKVANHCHLSCTHSTPTGNYGKSMDKRFMLIIPGDFTLIPGDRVFDGIGPEEVQWQTFVPALVPQLYELSYAKPCFWNGDIAHWEAGNKKEAV